MADYVQVATTTDQSKEAERIAHALVQRRLAACVQVVGPITSVYRWQGNIETAREWQCWAKTDARLVPRLQEAIRELHSYDEPEIVVVPIVGGSPSYLGWLAEQIDAEDPASG